MKHIVFFILFSLLENQALAESSYDKFCRIPEDGNIAMLCKISKSINVPVDKVGIGLIFASVDMIGTYCDFSLSRKYLYSRMKVGSDPEIDKSIGFLMIPYRGKPPPGFKGDKKVFCKVEYDMLGPSSKEKFFN